MRTREQTGKALYYAVVNDQPEHLTALLLENAKRADEDQFKITDSVVGTNTTLMEMAVSKRLWECIERIVKIVPADPEDKAKYGEAVLRALLNHKLQLVPLFLKSGAKANKVQNHLNQSCLHIAINIAIFNNDTLPMMLLLEQDKEKLYLSKKDQHQRTPQDILFQSNNIALMQHFLIHYQKKYGNDFVCENFIDPILEANNPDILKWLFNTRILTSNWQSKTGYRDHILHSLIRRSMSDTLNIRTNMLVTLKWFLAQGANLDVENEEKVTPIRLAARLGNFNAVVIILEHIKKIEKDDKPKYESVLVRAVHAQRLDVVRWLLEQGISPTNVVVTDDKNTCMHVAIQRKDLSILNALLQLSKDPTILQVKNKASMNPLGYAISTQYWDGVGAILDYMVKNHIAISYQENSSEIFKFILLNAANADRNDIIQLLLKTGMPASVIKPDLIILAVKSNMLLTATRVLLQNKYYLSVDTIDPANGDSLVHIAVRNHNSMMLEMLLEFKPDLTILNKDRETALELSLKILLEADLKFIPLIKEEGPAEDSDKLARVKQEEKVPAELARVKQKAKITELSSPAKNDRENFNILVNNTREGTITSEHLVEYAYLACLRKRFYIIPLLFQQGLPVDTIFPDGDTALHMMIRKYRLHDLEKCLTFNPDLTIKNSKEKMTPLSLAILILFMEGIEKILLKMGTINNDTKKLLLVFSAEGKKMPSSLANLLLKLGISNQEEQKEEKSREVDIKREKETTPEEEARLVEEHNRNYAEIKHEVMWATTLFAQDRRQHDSTSTFAVRKFETGKYEPRHVPDGVLFNILLMLGASKQFTHPNTIYLRIAHFSFLKENLNLEPDSISELTTISKLARTFVSTYRKNESSFFSRKRTIESQQFVKTLEDILLSPQYTADAIIAAVSCFVKSKEKDPKKHKSDTWKLLEKSGLLKFVNTQTIASEEKHVVSAETSEQQSQSLNPALRTTKSTVG